MVIESVVVSIVHPIYYCDKQGTRLEVLRVKRISSLRVEPGPI